MPYVSAPFEDCFIPEPNSGCWLWERAVDNNGYGSLTFRQKRYKAHRRSWELYRGAIPEGAFLLHKCDTPACVNPDHLTLGTQADNIADMVRKRRGCHGEKSLTAKLTETQARAIIEDPRNQFQIAAFYGVDQSTVSQIKSGKRWKHLNA